MRTIANGLRRPFETLSRPETCLRLVSLGGGFGLVMHIQRATVVAMISTILTTTLAVLGRPTSRRDTISLGSEERMARVNERDVSPYS